MQNDVVNLEYGTTGAVRSVVVSQEAVDMRNLALGRIAGKNLKLKKEKKTRCRDYYAFFFLLFLLQSNLVQSHTF